MGTTYSSHIHRYGTSIFSKIVVNIVNIVVSKGLSRGDNIQSMISIQTFRSMTVGMVCEYHIHTIVMFLLSMSSFYRIQGCNLIE